MKTLANKFKQLDSEKQWKWVVKNPDKIEMITLDNDCTSIMFKGDEPDDDRYANFIDDIGNRAGVHHILEALGIPHEDC